MTKITDRRSTYPGFVLGVHPTQGGFGWVLFETPQSPVAWPIVHARAGREAHLLKSFRRLLERYEPAVLVMEDFEDGESRRSTRIRKLCRKMTETAEALNVPTRVFGRDAIRAAFAKFGAMTRSEIARVIAERVEGFGHRLPPVRRIWNSFDARQSLFDAAAVVITHFVSTGDLEMSI